MASALKTAAHQVPALLIMKRSECRNWLSVKRRFLYECSLQFLCGWAGTGL